MNLVCLMTELGLLADMKGVPVTSVALGKAHAVMLTDSGHVYTFGPNNKGQCGRDFTSTNRERTCYLPQLSSVAADSKNVIDY